LINVDENTNFIGNDLLKSSIFGSNRTSSAFVTLRASNLWHTALSISEKAKWKTTDHLVVKLIQEELP
jgi:hypothetical protein